jgi:hypothetical protein
MFSIQFREKDQHFGANDPLHRNVTESHILFKFSPLQRIVI